MSNFHTNVLWSSSNLEQALMIHGSATIYFVVSFILVMEYTSVYWAFQDIFCMWKHAYEYYICIYLLNIQTRKFNNNFID